MITATIIWAMFMVVTIYLMLGVKWEDDKWGLGYLINGVTTIFMLLIETVVYLVAMVFLK